MPRIESLDHPAIQPFTTLKQMSLQPDRFPLVVAEGTKVVERLLSSSLPIKSILCTPEKYEQFAEQIRRKHIPESAIFIASRSVLEQIVGFKYHQGIMALLSPPPPLPLHHLAPPYLILNGLSNAENVGLITRSLRAFGLRSLITDSATCSPFIRRAIRVSMGMCFEIHWHQTSDITTTVERLRQAGTTLIALELHPAARPIWNVDFPSNVALLVGSEASGIDSSLLQRCDYIVALPAQSLHHSLNVATACSIALYEYCRHHPLLLRNHYFAEK